MEKTRTGILASFIDTFKSFVKIQEVNDGKIDEGKLTAEERKILAEIRKMDKVERLEGRAELKKRYGATVDTAKASKNAKNIVREDEGKTIESK